MYYNRLSKQWVFTLYDEILLYAVISQFLFYFSYWIYQNIILKNSKNETTSNKKNYLLKNNRGGFIFTVDQAYHILELQKFKYNATKNLSLSIYFFALENSNYKVCLPGYLINFKDFNIFAKKYLQVEKENSPQILSRIRGGAAEIVQVVDNGNTLGTSLSVSLVSLISGSLGLGLGIIGTAIYLLVIRPFFQVVSEDKNQELQEILAQLLLNTITLSIVAVLEAASQLVVPERKALQAGVKIVLGSGFSLFFGGALIKMNPLGQIAAIYNPVLQPLFAAFTIISSGLVVLGILTVFQQAGYEILLLMLANIGPGINQIKAFLIWLFKDETIFNNFNNRFSIANNKAFERLKRLAAKLGVPLEYIISDSTFTVLLNNVVAQRTEFLVVDKNTKTDFVMPKNEAKFEHLKSANPEFIAQSYSDYTPNFDQLQNDLQIDSEANKVINNNKNRLINNKLNN